jgi:hypothetical protein
MDGFAKGITHFVPLIIRRQRSSDASHRCVRFCGLRQRRRRRGLVLTNAAFHLVRDKSRRLPSSFEELVKINKKKSHHTFDHFVILSFHHFTKFDILVHRVRRTVVRVF